MKVGDRLYCWNGNHNEYTIGIYYYIDYILDDGIRISSNYGDNWFVVSRIFLHHFCIDYNQLLLSCR